MADKILYKQVLFIGPQFKNGRGGMATVLTTYARHIKDFKFIATYNGNYSLLINIIYFINSLLCIAWKLLSDRTIDIVHIHSASRGSFYRMYIVFIVTKFIFGKKIIFHIHGGGFQVFYNEANKSIKKLIRHLLRKTDVLICLSEKWYRYLKDHFEIKKLYILNNPVEPPFPANLPIHQNSKIQLLFLGRIEKEKGVFDLLEVILKHQDDFKDKITLFLGGNGDTIKLKDVIKKNKLDEFIKYEGWVNGKQKHQLLSICDVFILPSYFEGLPVSILEAMSYGAAIIASNVGGIPEVVKDNENGFLIEPGDTTRLKLCLDILIGDPFTIQRMKGSSRNKVKSYYTSNILAKLGEIYSETLKI